jgi:hypothetical protein
MLAAMPQRVYREWMVYAEMEPWDQQRADWRAAMIASTMANLWRGKKGRRRKLKDFLPVFKRSPGRPRTKQQAANLMAAMAKMYGGQVQDNRPEWKKKRDGPLNL